MSEAPAGYYSDADAIRAALAKSGPMTRDELVKLACVERSALAKSLYALKKQGNVIEEGDRVMLAKASIPAQVAPKEEAVPLPTVQADGCDTEPASPSPDHMAPAPLHPSAVDPRGDPQCISPAIQAVANLADYCRSLYHENKELLLKLAAKNEPDPELIAVRKALHDLRAKLRALTDD